MGRGRALRKKGRGVRESGVGCLERAWRDVLLDRRWGFLDMAGDTFGGYNSADEGLGLEGEA